MRIRNGFKELTLWEALHTYEGRRGSKWLWVVAPFHHIYRRLTGDVPFDPASSEQMTQVKVPNGPPTVFHGHVDHWQG